MFPHSHNVTEDLLSPVTARRALSCFLTAIWEQARCRQQDFQISDYRWWKQGWETEKQLSHMEAPLLLYPHPKHTPSPWGEQPLPPHRKFPAPLSSYAHPTELRAPGTQKKIYSTTGWWEQLCFCFKSLPSKPTSGNGVAASLQSENLKLTENQKSKVTETFAVALFPLQWLLYLEKRFNCNTANIFGEHSKAWSRTTPKHAEGGGTGWLSVVFWVFFYS